MNGHNVNIDIGNSGGCKNDDKEKDNIVIDGFEEEDEEDGPRMKKFKSDAFASDDYTGEFVGLPDNEGHMDTASVSIDLDSSACSNDAMEIGGGEKPLGDPPDSPD